VTRFVVSSLLDHMAAASFIAVACWLAAWDEAASVAVDAAVSLGAVSVVIAICDRAWRL
jgi:hypothetical protein